MAEVTQPYDGAPVVKSVNFSRTYVPHETSRTPSKTTTVQTLAPHLLVDELPWKYLPTKESLPLVDLRQGTHGTTFFIDTPTRLKAEAVLSSFYEELCSRSPRPEWVPSENLSFRSLICIMLRIIERHDLLPLFIENGILDQALPLDMPTLQSFLKDTKTIEAFRKVQYQAKLRDLSDDGIAVYHADEILPFRTVRALGHGGFATVDCVEHVLRGYEVAHKTFMLTPRLEQRMQDTFRAEIASLKRLSGYRHIVEYVGAYRSPHCLGLLLRPVADCDLFQFLKSPTAFGFSGSDQQELLFRSFGCLSSALAYMHSQRIRHKDIKGQNVLVERTASGTNLLLTDFGIAMDFSEIEMSTTKGPLAQKTERYCAPEVAGGRERGRRSDVYSLGCLFVEVATVLMGFDLKDLDNELGGDGIFHESELQLSNWISKLERMAESPLIIILQWISTMIRKHPGSRPQMHAVVDNILQDTKSHKELRGQMFCATCIEELRDLKKISSVTMGIGMQKSDGDSDYGSDEEGCVQDITPNLRREGHRSRSSDTSPENVSEMNYESGPSSTERIFVDIATIPRLRAGSVAAIVQVYVSLVNCLRSYNMFANTAKLWPPNITYLLRRLDFEMLRLLNWGFVVGLSRGGPLQPSDLELASNVELIQKNLARQQTEIERYLEECRIPIDALRRHDSSSLNILIDRHIPGVSQSLLRSLLSSVLVKTGRSSSVEELTPNINHRALVDTLTAVEGLNNDLRALLDKSTSETLLERDAETNLELLQLSETLPDIVNLICAVRPGMHSSVDFTHAGTIELLADVSGSTAKTDHRGLGTRDAVAQFARFKALNTMVETYEGNLWEAVKQAAAGSELWEARGRDAYSNIELMSKDITLFDDEIDMDEDLPSSTSAFCRVGNNKKQKRLVWIEWKTYEDTSPMPYTEGPPAAIISRVRKLALLLNDPDKPKEFCVPHCLGYFHYIHKESDELGSGPLGFVFQVPSHVPASFSFKPTSLLDLMQSIPHIPVFQRLELAFRISSCVLYFHSVNWLHKGLRSQSIIFFPDTSGSANLQDPIVSGFDYSRPAPLDDMTERPRDDPYADIYRHPVVQSTGNRESTRGGRAFRKAYDIYSLGIVLAEIAYWKPIYEILDIDMDVARPKHTWVVRNRLLQEDHVFQGICDSLGPDYWEVFKTCIEGAEALGLNPGDDEHDPTVAATLQATFYRKVVRRLKHLIKGQVMSVRF